MNNLKYIYITFIIILFNTESILSIGCRIDFKVNGMAYKQIVLAHYYGNRQIIVDTIKFNNEGNGYYQSNNRLSGGIYLCILPNNKFFELLINDEQFFTVETDTANIFGNLVIEGAWETAEFVKYQQNALKHNTKPNISLTTQNTFDTLEIYRYKIINKHPNSFIAAYFKLLTNTKPSITNHFSDKKAGLKAFTLKYNYLKLHYWENLNFTDTRLLKTSLIADKCNFYFNKLLLQKADTIIPAIDSLIDKANVNAEFYRFILGFLINNYKQTNNSETEKVYLHIAENYYLNGKAPWADNRYIDMLRQRVKTIAPISIGIKAPNLTFELQNGSEQTIYNINANWLVLYFWSPDCEVCKKETPLLNQIYKQYKAKGLKILAIYTHADRLMWDQYLAKNNLNWLHVYDPLLKSNFTKIYQIQSTPQIYLLDAEKNIVAKKINTTQLNTILLQKQ